MHVCEQSYTKDLAQLEYNCELLFTSVAAAEITCY